MKRYGIYLAYPPQIDLRAEGLGRHLAELLKAAEVLNIRFVLVCPSWSRSSIADLCEANGIAVSSFDLVSPKRQPLLLSSYKIWVGWRGKRSRRSWRHFLSFLGGRLRNSSRRVIKSIVSTRSPVLGIPLIVGGAILSVFSLPILLFLIGRRIILSRTASLNPKISKWWIRPSLALRYAPQRFPLVEQLYRLLEESEASLLVDLAEASEARAWFAPTAFWPHFNSIKRPRLMCVPDLSFMQFPVGFGMSEARLISIYRQIGRAVAGSNNLVTYSDDVKNTTLIEHFRVPSHKIDVVRHGANAIDHFIRINGTPDDEAATRTFCENLFQSALRKAIDQQGDPANGSGTFPFLFYASQFRPSKNVVSLLRAYDYLLKRKFLNMKLVLTGQPNVLPEIAEFLDANNLRNDVLCLHGLTNQEWAACYKLATLAVNPSLAEGGCPFTFSEALSVGTPVVMSRIPVTEEVIVDPEIRTCTFFDPYNWQDIAARIEWALENRDTLYQAQRKYYDEVISQRTWQHVVNEYIAILDRISELKNTENEKEFQRAVAVD